MDLIQKSCKIIALVLVICLVNVFAQRVNNNSNADSRLPRYGVLIAPDAQESVLVNGSRTADGMTIVSGVDLKTTRNGATILVNETGKVEICPRTEANLTYDDNFIKLVISGGSARVTTAAGAAGTIVVASGETLKADSDGTVATPNFQPCNVGVGVAVTSETAVNGISKLGTIGTILTFAGFAGVALAATLIAASGDDAPISIGPFRP